MATIYLECLSPNTSSDLPKDNTNSINILLFGLASDGVFPANNVTIIAVRSYACLSLFNNGEIMKKGD